MIEMLIAALLTLFLGPGIGHLFLRKFKRALYFISGSLAIVFAFALYISKYLYASLPANAASLNMKDSALFLSELYKKNPTALLVFEIAFAAFWAYSITDVIIIAKSNLPGKKTAEDEKPPDDNA